MVHGGVMVAFVLGRGSERSRRLALSTLSFLLSLAVGACAGGSSSPAPATATIAASTRPTPSTGQSPSLPAPSATPDAATPYDGIWASEPLTRADLAAALARRDLGDARLDEWFPDWDGIDYRIFEIEIGNGRWLQHENAEGVPFGTGWAGDLELTDADTVIAQDDEFRCPVSYDLRRDGDTLSVRIADDACSDPDDLPIQVAMYESSPFRLVQAADWDPAAPSADPSGPASGTPPGSEASTSSSRQAPRPIGTVDGAPLGYLEYLPPEPSGGASPLLVFLHGSGESGAGDELGLATLASAGIPALIRDDQWPDERPFVVLSPQHEELAPSFCFEADEIDAFLRFALEHYDIDPTRVYLTGLSCGAIGLWNYLADHGDEIVAAAVPIAGYGIGAIQRAGCNLGRVPIWAFHGSADDRVPVRGDVYPVATLQACTDPAPVDAAVKVYQGQGHDAWTETYRSARYDIYGWLLSHQR